MNFLLDPNVAYVLLVGGFVFAILALFTPGTGILEIGALFALLLAGYSIVTLPINWWALAILILGVFPFLLAVRRSGQYLFLVISIAALIIGTVFLFRSQPGQAASAINPVLAVVVSVTATLLLWFIGRQALEAIMQRPVHDLSRLKGETGTAETDIWHEGTVYVSGEDWTARSEKAIKAGSKVRITGRTGLMLLVEEVDSGEEKADK